MALPRAPNFFVVCHLVLYLAQYQCRCLLLGSSLAVLATSKESSRHTSGAQVKFPLVTYRMQLDTFIATSSVNCLPREVTLAIYLYTRLACLLEVLPHQDTNCHRSRQTSWPVGLRVPLFLLRLPLTAVNCTSRLFLRSS